MSASNCTDLDHCECVDGLHKRIANLEQQLAELQDKYDALRLDYISAVGQQQDAHELQAKYDALREAAQKVVGRDWFSLKSDTYHVDWFDALVDVGLLEKRLQEQADE